MAEELKYRVEIEYTKVDADGIISKDALDRVIELGKAIESLNKQLAELRAMQDGDAGSTEDLAKAQAQLADQLQQATKALADQNKQITAAQASIQSADKAMSAFGKSTQEATSSSAHAGLAELTRQAASTRNEIAKLREEMIANGAATNDQRDELERLKTELKATQSEYTRQQRELTKVTLASDGLVESYNDLVKQNAALSAVMRALPLDDTSGELATLQAAYNANNERLKQFDVSMGNHQRNVGNYSSGLKGMGQILSGLPGIFGQAGSALTKLSTATGAANTMSGKASTGFKGLFTVLRANPIGLIITAITALVGILSKVAPVTDGVQRIFAVFGATLDTVTEYIGAFIKGTDRSTISLAENTKAALANIRAKQLLRDTEAGFITAQGQIERNIINLTARLTDQNLTYDDQIKLLVEIENQQQQLINLQLTRLRVEIDAAKTDVERAEKQKEFDNLRATLFARQISDIKEITAVEQDRASNQEAAAKKHQDYLRSLAAANRAYAESIRSENESIINSLSKLDEAILQVSIDKTPDMDFDTGRDNAILANAEQFGQELAVIEIANAIRTGDQLKVLDLQQAEDIRQRKLFYMSLNFTDAEAAQMALTDMTISHAQERADAELAIERAKADQQVQLIVNLGNTITGIGTAMFGKNKAIAIAQAIIDTYAAANSAAKNTPGGFLIKAAATAAMIAKGLANVRTIMSTNIGSTGTGGTGTTGGNMVGMSVTAAGTLMPTNFGLQAPMAGEVGATMSPAQAEAAPIYVDASVDERGMAIAVRRGESQIRSQQVVFT
jgi:hypothetical protein